MTLTIALLTSAAQAQPHEPPPAISAEDMGERGDDREAPRPAVVTARDRDGGTEFALQYGLHFLPYEEVGQQGALRVRGPKDAFLGAEIRLTPSSDHAWVGRVAAGFDVLGKSKFDLDLGLSLGAAGEWDRTKPQAVLYAAPVVGTEVGVGYDGKRLLAKYRWLNAIGAGPLDEVLTENELTIGYRLLPVFQLYGQFLALAPGELDTQYGVGLGVRAVF